MEVQNRSQNTISDKIPIGRTVFLKSEGLLSKLEPRFKGPYKIIEHTKGGNYTVENALKETLAESFPRHKIKVVEDYKNLPDESAEVEKIIKHKDVDKDKYFLYESLRTEHVKLTRDECYIMVKSKKCNEFQMECENNYCSNSSDPKANFKWMNEVTTETFSCTTSPKQITANSPDDLLFNGKCKVSDRHTIRLEISTSTSMNTNTELVL
ncbi:unnamed protein product, partial [Brachionus calyciflorus]